MCAREYRPSLDTLELVVELEELLKEQRQTERLICRYLADLADRMDPTMSFLSGYSDVYHLARRQFGLGFRATRERIRVGRALRELPATEQALVSGTLSYSKVREVTRVARPEDEVSWLREASRLPMRTLEQRVVEVSARQAAADAVCGASDGNGHGNRPAPSAPEVQLAGLRDRHCIHTHFRSPKLMDLQMTVSPDTWALLERAMQGARRESEQALSVEEALAAVARDALARQAQGPADLRRTVVLYECGHCRRTELDTGGQPMDLLPEAAASLGCGAPIIDLEREGRFVQRGGPMPAAVRRAVLLRDRHCCRVPGCQLRRYVDVHHLEEQCLGGAHSRKNCLCLCERHHRMLHAGQLRIEGNADAAPDAPDGLRFFHADGEPFKDPEAWLNAMLDGSGFMTGGRGGAPAAASPNTQASDRPGARTHCGSGAGGGASLDSKPSESSSAATHGGSAPGAGAATEADASKQGAVATHCGSAAGGGASANSATTEPRLVATQCGSAQGAGASADADGREHSPAATHCGSARWVGASADADAGQQFLAATHSGSEVGEEEHLDDWSRLSPEANRLLAVMGHRGGWSTDPLCEASGLSLSQVHCAMLMLELAGRVKRDWTGVYTPLG